MRAFWTTWRRVYWVLLILRTGAVSVNEKGRLWSGVQVEFEGVEVRQAWY